MNTYKILVAEDEPALLYSLSVRLESAGYEVLCAQDGYQAVAMAGEHLPDLLILDVHLPAGDGFSVEERVRKMPQLQHVPIIYSTGDRSQEMLDRASELSVRWLLQKPFDSTELLQVVRQSLEEDEAREEAVVR